MKSFVWIQVLVLAAALAAMGCMSSGRGGGGGGGETGGGSGGGGGGGGGGSGGGGGGGSGGGGGGGGGGSMCNGDWTLAEVPFVDDSAGIGQACDGSPPRNCRDGSYINFPDGRCVCLLRCSSLS